MRIFAHPQEKEVIFTIVT